jgi:hypothetical protein
MEPRRGLGRLVADLDARATGSGASGSASSAWAASAGGRPPRQGFGMSIHYHNRRRVPGRSKKSSRRPIGTASTRCWRAWTWCRCNCPHTPATFHLLSARRLKLMKPEAYHRQHRARRGDRRSGADSHAGSRQLAGAGLDVFEHEPAVDPKLIKLATTWCCCRTWDRPPSRAASTWARR